jgi:hypothetical protein
LLGLLSLGDKFLQQLADWYVGLDGDALLGGAHFAQMLLHLIAVDDLGQMDRGGTVALVAFVFHVSLAGCISPIIILGIRSLAVKHCRSATSYAVSALAAISSIIGKWHLMVFL